MLPVQAVSSTAKYFILRPFDAASASWFHRVSAWDDMGMTWLDGVTSKVCRPGGTSLLVRKLAIMRINALFGADVIALL